MTRIISHYNESFFRSKSQSYGCKEKVFWIFSSVFSGPFSASVSPTTILIDRGLVLSSREYLRVFLKRRCINVQSRLKVLLWALNLGLSVMYNVVFVHFHHNAMLCWCHETDVINYILNLKDWAEFSTFSVFLAIYRQVGQVQAYPEETYRPTSRAFPKQEKTVQYF